MNRGLAYWNQKNANYPFHAQEDRAGNRVPFQTRDIAELERKYGMFLRCPAPEIGVVLWGFETEDALTRFLADFGLSDERGKGGPA